MWVVFAFGSALFAGVTSILAKIGIKNTDLRIKIFYGSESGISVESCPGNGCEITVVIQLGNNT